MKKFILLILLIFSCTFCFAYKATSWFAPYSAGFNVNLQDTSTYTGAAQGNYKAIKWETAGYNDSTLVAVTGVMLEEENGGIEPSTVTISVSMDFKGNTPWTYVSASEPYLKRPFGMDFVICYTDNKDTPRDVVSIRPTSNGGVEAIYDKNNLNATVNEKDGTVSFKLPLDVTKSVVWMDVVLVLPDKADMSTALSADDYYCGITVSMDVVNNATGAKVSGGHNNWTYSFNGYISSRPDASSARVFFNVLPNATAYSINVSSLENKNEILIGSYSYETQSFLHRLADDGDLEYDIQKYNNYYIFASSSKDPNDSDGEFRLTLQGLDSSQIPEEYTNTSFKYEIGIVSDKAGSNATWISNSPFSIEEAKSMFLQGNSIKASTVSLPLQSDSGAWYDGTDSTSTWANRHPPILGIRIDEPMRDGMRSLVFRDSGNIYIRAVDENLDASQLSSGVYTSIVYFHVISNF